MLTNDTKVIIQTRAKAAAKTFVQAFVGVLMLMVVPQLAGWAAIVANGGTIDIDIKWWANVLVAAAGGGIAAAISWIWNTLLKPTDVPVVTPPPVAVDQ